MCSPKCPDGMPMAVWPHKELSDYVCLVPAHEHDEDSFKEIEIEKQKKDDSSKKTPTDDKKAAAEVKPPKKEKKDGESLALEPKTPEKMKPKDQSQSQGQDKDKDQEPEIVEEKQDTQPKQDDQKSTDTQTQQQPAQNDMNDMTMLERILLLQ